LDWKFAYGPALALIATPVAAQEADPIADETREQEGGVVSAAIGGGTLGIGPEVGWRFSDHMGVRADASFLRVGADPSSDDLDYDARLKLQSYGAMVDVYPFGGAFRISAGARINRNRADLLAQLPGEGSVGLGDGTYTAAQVGRISGEADVKGFAPAFTLGWGGSKRRGMFIAADAGVLLQGSVRVREFTATGTSSGDPDFRADLEQERQAIQDDVDDYKVYPIVTLRIGYRF
tara:strand:- start:341 stop:1042 length:702 start_codon:yes stop_codon:yes gene_type:complete